MSEIDKRHQVAYLGPEGTYSYSALIKYFGTQQHSVPCATIEDVFASVENGDCDYGVVPVENSSEGSITATLDCLNLSLVNICGEVLLRIQQVLMVHPQTSQDLISRIVSHQQSLGQCRNWLDKHYPGVDRVAVSSNGEAARIAARETGVAAIASQTAAEINQLEVLAQEIEDSRDNTTRFLIISKKYQAAISGPSKTSIIFHTPNEPGTLFKALEPFKQHEVNLNKLESRPDRKEVWSYAFYVDMDGHHEDENVSAALRELTARNVGVKILGSYPVSGTVHEELAVNNAAFTALQGKKVVIVGLGLIGGSIAKGLIGLGNIWAVGPDETSLQTAQEMGVIQGYSAQLEGVCEDADLVIIAVPGLSVAPIMESLAGLIKPECVITDVTSVKKSTLDAALAAFGEIPANLVPGHPIAGSEQSGFKAAKADLFRDHRVILTPSEETDPTALSLISMLWQGLGAEVLNMQVAEHDAILAATSHLPHLLAYALVDTLSHQGSSEEIFRYAAGGFRDFTRIASSNPHMWKDIFISNALPIKALVEAFEKDLEQLKRALLEGDSEFLMSTLQTAKQSRDKFLSKK